MNSTSSEFLGVNDNASNKKFIIRTPGGKIKFLLTNEFDYKLLEGVIFDKKQPFSLTNFADEEVIEFQLTFKKSIIEDLLVPYFRKGRIYISDFVNNTEYIELLKHISGNNKFLVKCSKILEGHGMDLFGREIPINLIKFIDINSFYILSWNYSESRKLLDTFQKESGWTILNFKIDTEENLKYLCLQRDITPYVDIKVHFRIMPFGDINDEITFMNSIKKFFLDLNIDAITKEYDDNKILKRKTYINIF